MSRRSFMRYTPELINVKIKKVYKTEINLSVKNNSPENAMAANTAKFFNHCIGLMDIINGRISCSIYVNFRWSSLRFIKYAMEQLILPLIISIRPIQWLKNL